MEISEKKVIVTEEELMKGARSLSACIEEMGFLLPLPVIIENLQAALISLQYIRKLSYFEMVTEFSRGIKIFQTETAKIKEQNNNGKPH